ncbi:serine hydrolase [Tumebacillus sp. ITR2]|uniref:Serine hydrolase n=1 Tax=Tumebacillus amylolyticus TaxID=2801339 RepID=A0ABS1JAR6_9BACL|nr:serine hydrolase [Tumebacillus amylolyticus]MBL0387344.1 serine hydrolase [Tumebacillus amylolyticus]
MLNALSQQLTERLEAASETFGVSIHHFQSQESFHYNADEVFFAASIIKVPIMAAVFDQASKGQLTMSETMTLRLEDKVTGSGILYYLSPGLQITIWDLVVLMIIESDNTATNMLMDRIGTPTIQACMKEWGMENTRIYNKLSVVPANLQHVNTITPREMTDFMIKLAQSEIVSWKACREMIGILKQQKFNDGIPSLLPTRDEQVGEIPTYEMAHKTGWVSKNEHDSGLLYFPGHTFAISVFTGDVTDHAATRRVMGEIGLLLYNALFK